MRYEEDSSWWNGFWCGMVILIGTIVIAGLVLFATAVNHKDKVNKGCGSCSSDNAPPNAGDRCGPYVCTVNDGWE